MISGEATEKLTRFLRAGDVLVTGEDNDVAISSVGMVV